jgi:hypothetical protein
MSTLEYVAPIHKTAGHLFEAACQLISGHLAQRLFRGFLRDGQRDQPGTAFVQMKPPLDKVFILR